MIRNYDKKGETLGKVSEQSSDFTKFDANYYIVLNY